MLRRRSMFLALAVLAAVLCSSCASAPIATPETPRQRYYMAEAGYASVLDATATLRASGAISDDVYKDVLAPAFDAVEAALDIAWGAIKSDADGQEDALVAVHQALLHAKALLNRYGGVSR